MVLFETAGSYISAVLTDHTASVIIFLKSHVVCANAEEIINKLIEM